MLTKVLCVLPTSVTTIVNINSRTHRAVQLCPVYHDNSLCDCFLLYLTHFFFSLGLHFLSFVYVTIFFLFKLFSFVVLCLQLIEMTLWVLECKILFQCICIQLGPAIL